MLARESPLSTTESSLTSSPPCKDRGLSHTSQRTRETVPLLDSTSNNTVHSFTTQPTATERPMPTPPIPAPDRTALNPADNRRPAPAALDPIHQQHLRWTEKTTPKLSQIVHPDRTISSVSLEIVHFSGAEKFPSQELSEEPLEGPNATAERPHPDTPAVAPIRTQSNKIEQTDLNTAEPGWTGLNEPERPEHPIPRRTLEIVPFPRPKETPAKQRAEQTTEPRPQTIRETGNA